MKLKEIHLENFRCYKDLTICLNDNLTVLVAPNGQGKTSILDAISILLWSYVGQFDLASDSKNPNYTSVSIDDIRLSAEGGFAFTEKKFFYAPANMIPHLPCSLTAKAYLNENNEKENLITWSKFRDSFKSRSKTKERGNYKKLHDFAKSQQDKILNKENIPLPIFAYYGTNRLWSKKRLTTNNKFKNDIDLIRTFAYRDCLDSASSYKQFASWFKYCNETFSEYIKKKILTSESPFHRMEIDSSVSSPIDVVTDAINICLKKVGWQFPSYDAKKDDIVLMSSTGTLKLDQLSDGIQNIFAIVSDIAYRCYLLNSYLGKNATKETEGVILIDEVDMHLHPEWQQVILGDLQAAFPKLQFIVTTHSPQVLSTIKKEHIRVVRDGSIEEVLSNTYGELSSDVMHRVQGVNPRPPITEREDLEKLTVLVDSGKFESKEVTQLLDELIKKLGDKHEAIIRIQRSIQRQKILATLKQR